MIGPCTGTPRMPPVARSTTKSLPDKENAATRKASSVVYATTPPARVRVRSRAARSSADSVSTSPSTAAGSTSRVSAPVATSRLHRLWAGSLPDAERRNSTRPPSGVTRISLGVPRVNRCVRACNRRNESAGAAGVMSSLVTAMTLSDQGRRAPVGRVRAPAARSERGDVPAQAVVVAAGRGHALPHRIGTVAVPLEVPVLDLDTRAVRSLRHEPHLDLAGLRGVRVVPPVTLQLPRVHEAVRRIPHEHPAPVALAAVDTGLVPAAAHLRFERAGGHVRFADVVLLGPPR